MGTRLDFSSLSKGIESSVSTRPRFDEIKFTLKSFSTLTMVAVDEKLAEAAALIRARHGIRLPDALQVAAAIYGEATLFITNDKRLSRIDALEILVLSDYLQR